MAGHSEGFPPNPPVGMKCDKEASPSNWSLKFNFQIKEPLRLGKSKQFANLNS